MKDLKRALGYLKPYQWTAIGAIASMLLVTGVNLINPQILSWVIDQGLGSLDENIILIGIFALVGIALGQGIFNFLQGFLSEKASQSVAYDLRNLAVHKNPISEFQLSRSCTDWTTDDPCNQ